MKTKSIKIQIKLIKLNYPETELFEFRERSLEKFPRVYHDVLFLSGTILEKCRI